MWKLKIKRTDQIAYTAKEFDTLQEVADHIAMICSSTNISNIMRNIYECNFRFYITRINKQA